MFFYSENTLTELAKTRSLFESSATRKDEVCEETRFKLASFVKPIIQIEKISIPFTNKVDNSQFYILLLSDSHSKSFGMVTEATIHHIIYNYYLASRLRFIEDKHVIMLYEYSLMSQSNQVLRDDQISYFMSSFDADDINKELPLLVLESFTIIGQETSITKGLLSTTKKEAAAASAESHHPDYLEDLDHNQTDPDPDHNQTESRRESLEIMSISSLSSSMSNQNWTIKSCLSKISPVKEFPYKKGDIGRVMRMQFYDRTGYIEVVFFNDYIDRYIDFFEIGKCYYIRNSEIKYSKKTYRAWPDDLYSNFDIIVTKTTEFEQADDEIILKSEIAPPSHLKPSLEQESENGSQKSPNTQQQQQQSNFTTLSELILNKNKCLVDVIGVVCDIGDMAPVNRINNKTKLYVRRIKIVDETAAKPMSVAFWGKQASELDVNIGDIYMFKGAELSSFGGVSLSVLRSTGFMDITGYFNVPGVERLAMWWRKVKSQYSGPQANKAINEDNATNKSHNQRVNKRDRTDDKDDDEESSHNPNKKFKQG